MATVRADGAHRIHTMRIPVVGLVLLMASAAIARAQVQVELKFSRLQYIAYEPLNATVSITNRAGRDIDLRDADSQSWFGFEVTRNDGESVGSARPADWEPLHIGASQTVTRKINLSPLFSMEDFGAYHVRAHLYFADLGRYFYSPTKVVQVTSARPIWKQSVGVPDASGGGDGVRTYSLMTNRFPDHTSLYVRVEDESRGVVYATYSLGRVVSFDEPRAEIDRANRLHVLHCAGPRTWSAATIGLNGELLTQTTLLETKTRPHFKKSGAGEVTVVGGMSESALPAPLAAQRVPKLSARPERGKPEE
ncbi:MAG: hypothetical protein ABI839_01910 [Verrucomicrobiota bacterium]